MSLNKTVLNGKIPFFDAKYTAGDGNKKSFLMWSVSVPRDMKKDDEQYYPEDLIPIKAFGAKADFIMNHFPQGSGIVIEGRITKDDDYMDKQSGEQKKGGLYVLVQSVYFPSTGNSSNNGNSRVSNNSSASVAPHTPPVSRPGSHPTGTGHISRPGSRPWNIKK